MKQLITYFIKYPISGNIIMFLILLFGLFALFATRKTFFPERESQIISIQIAYPGASPEEIEEGVVTKIEENLKGLTGIDQVQSVSSENTAAITIEVLKDFETDVILQDVKNAVDRISSFPVGMEPPVIYKRESRNFTISFALSGDVSLKTLKNFARQIETDLRATDGVSKITIDGYPTEEIEIAFNEDALQAYNITFQQASAAVSQQNVQLTGGTIKGDREEFLIRAKSKKYFAEDLKNIVIKATEDGRVIRLRDVADVRDIWSDSPNRSYLNKKPSVVITVENTVEEDMMHVVAVTKEYIDKFNEQNDVVKITVIRDGSVTLQQRIDLLISNGKMGFFLVLIFLALFLNIRLAFWVALSIPVAFMGMFILGISYDLTINVMSLFGMILVIGILVDDGIVISENIYQKYEQGMPAIQAAIEGTMEVLPSVFSAVLTTVIGFVTFFFLDGRLGNFVPDLAFVVIATLMISLVEGAFILPGHIAHSKALKGDHKQKLNKVERAMNAIMDYLKTRLYAPVLRFALNNRALTMAIPIALFMITRGGLLGELVKVTFFPSIDSDIISVVVELPAGTRDNVTEEVLDRIEAAAWRVNDTLKLERADGRDVVRNVELKIGPGINKGTVNVLLLDNEARNMPSIIIANAIRKEAGTIHEAEKLSFGTGSPWGKPISVSILGNNLIELEKASEEMKEAISELQSVKDIVDNNQKGVKEVKITLKDKAYLLGLNLQTVISQVRQGFFGNEVQRLQRGIDEVRVWVRYDETGRSSLSKLEDMRIRTSDGKQIPLKEIADYSIERGIIAINHLDGKREIRVEADLSNPKESAPSILANIKEELIPPIKAKHPSVTFSFEGQSKESQKVITSVNKVIPIILILMFAMVVLTFRSVTQSLVVFLLIPFSFIGVFWGHFFHGYIISMFSFFGIIALIGIMINDSLVLVSAMNSNLKAGKSYFDSLYDAGLTRFRPIILTSVTTIAGLAPLIFEKSFHAQFLIPMAIAVAYGLLVATVSTLVLLPVLLSLNNEMIVYLTWLWEGKKPTKEEVEPAIIELNSERETSHFYED